MHSGIQTRKPSLKLNPKPKPWIWKGLPIKRACLWWRQEGRIYWHWSRKELLELTNYNSVTIFPFSSLVHTSCECVFDVNLVSQLSLRSDIQKWVEQSWTAANSLQILWRQHSPRIRRKYEPGFMVQGLAPQGIFSSFLNSRFFNR